MAAASSSSETLHSIISLRGSTVQSDFRSPSIYCQAPLKSVLSTSITTGKQSNGLDVSSMRLSSSGTLGVCTQSVSIPNGSQIQPLYSQTLGIVNGSLFRQAGSSSHTILNTTCISAADCIPSIVEHNSLHPENTCNNYNASGNSCPIKKSHQPFVTSCFYSPWL